MIPQSDSQATVKLYIGKDDILDINCNLILQCRALISQIEDVNLEFALRNTNRVPDLLAKDLHNSFILAM